MGSVLELSLGFDNAGACSNSEKKGDYLNKTYSPMPNFIGIK